MSVQKKSRETEQYIRFQNRVIAGLFLMLVLFAIAYIRLPKQITTYIPPDVSKGFVQKVGEVPPATVYGFSRTLWEELNYCEKDCGDEYPQRLQSYRAYLTDSCFLELDKHFKNNRSLFNYRSRMLLPTDNALYSPDRVTRTSEGTWNVSQEYLLRDLVNAQSIRNLVMEYPLKVIRSTRPLGVNQLGLEVDCYYGAGPQVIGRDNTNPQ